MNILDARGQACPIPVIMTKKALGKIRVRDLGMGSAVLRVLVDNKTAVENLSRLADSQGLRASAEEKQGEYEVVFAVGDISKTARASEPTSTCGEDRQQELEAGAKRYSIFISKETLGQGDGVLGANLMKMFIYTLSQDSNIPETMLFMNGGVKLPGGDNPQIIESLKVLAEQGTEILVCGTCLDFFGLSKEIPVGTISNMYDILTRMQNTDKLITV